MREKTVSEVMIPLESYAFVNPNDSIGKAVEVLLTSYRESGSHSRTVLVVDGNKLVGLLTMRSLLEALDPALGYERYFEESFWIEAVPPALEAFALTERFTDQCRKNCCQKVKDIMRSGDLITVDKNANLVKAIHLLVKNGINSLPVMDGEQVVGIIRTVEIVEEIHTLITQAAECRI